MDVHLAFRKGKVRGQRPCGGPLGGPSAVSGIHGHLCLKTANGKRSEITAVRRSEGRDGIPQRPARCLCPAPLRPASDSVGHRGHHLGGRVSPRVCSGRPCLVW